MPRIFIGFLMILLMVLIMGCGAANVPVSEPEQVAPSINRADAACLGDENAPVQVVLFSDFECPFCKGAAIDLERAHKDYPDKIRICYRYFPLRYHSQALNAAKAAEAAHLQGKFWEMHDKLFANNTELSDDIYLRLATEIGLDIDRFQKDMNSPQVADKVSADKLEGKELGVEGTPYVFMNYPRFGEPYRFWGFYSNLPISIYDIIKKTGLIRPDHTK